MAEFFDIFKFGEIGSRVVAAVENDMRKKSCNNYTLSDYINDFEGTQDELQIALIKMAAEVL